MDTSTARLKRARSLSSSSSSSTTSSIGEQSYATPSPPPPKYHKGPSSGTSSSSKPFLCVLPPTCSQPGTLTSYSTQEELDRHQGTFHNWICHVPIRDREITSPERNGSGGIELPEGFIGGRMSKGKRMKECLKVFPDKRLLELHHIEVHDPISRQKKENGKKIFECFLDSAHCGKKFINPKKRRRHMIDKHKYPPDYFFSITNHGINAIVQEDGLAMSLIRPRRDPPSASTHVPSAIYIHEASDRTDQSTSINHDTPPNDNGVAKKIPEIDMDDLTSKMESSLTFVPRGVRKAAKVKEKVVDVETGT
ncbi:hypothetical protein I302_103586 [Kwoniella bestiolae CBS 10118]|uniref:C2H2-type domain-containing protein n=1 Tax=Kwoniella bestiolae CBS 10118 TaxID=1296100 RepID=A0A1B9G8T4_9TREE|nr:hypothetical protein I302_02287 [Kwoniella bestiolae CBS 10118]OCF27445.1 hypothetical protein I302_02287 [Kwoniella bestiolae CBS 10118]